MNANDLFTQHTGSEEFTRYLMNTIITDGVKDVAKTLKCFWFLDIIVSYQTEKKFQAEEFQTWELKRVENDKFIVTATDGNKNILTTQKIPYSDFKHDLLTMWFCDNTTILLPSEY